MRNARRGPDEGLMERVRAEFREMPGLRLTPRQAQRLWGCDKDTCVTVLDHLVESRFLCRTRTDPWLFLDESCYHLNAATFAAAA